jgi:hypothetical protein
VVVPAVTIVRLLPRFESRMVAQVCAEDMAILMALDDLARGETAACPRLHLDHVKVRVDRRILAERMYCNRSQS